MKFDNWEKLGQTEFKGAFKTFLTKHYRMPDGKMKDFDIFWTPRGFSQVLALTPDNEVIVAKQYRPGPEKVCWEMPAGLVDQGETAEEAAIRELREETGYTSDGIITIAKSMPFHPYTDGVGNYFLALNCERTSELKFDDGEFIEVELVPLRRFVDEHLRQGHVTHADGVWLTLDYMKRNQLLQSDTDL